MEFAEIITLINQSGFPIAVALFTLVRLESTIKKNTEVIGEMSKVVHVLVVESAKGDK